MIKVYSIYKHFTSKHFTVCHHFQVLRLFMSQFQVS